MGAESRHRSRAAGYLSAGLLIFTSVGFGQGCPDDRSEPKPLESPLWVVD